MRNRLFLFSAVSMLLLLAVLAGCKEDPLGPEEEYVPPPIALTHPDSLVLAFELAWVWQDSDRYATLLYSGDEESPRATASEPFTFYFAPGTDQWSNPLPQAQTYAAEIANVAWMFSGDAGVNDTPGVETIDLILTANGIWTEPPTDLVEGDQWPAGTLQCFYDTDMLVMLKGEIPGSANINGLQVNGRLLFYAIPVSVTVAGEQEPRTEYRLWKWRDLTDGFRTEDSSFSTVKALYLEPPPPPQFDLSDPDEFVDAFVHAWKELDSDFYASLLYDGASNMTWEEGSSDFRSFTFYYAPGVDLWGNPLPIAQNLEEETANITRMLSGNEGINQIPGVDTIDLTLTANGIWAAPPTALVEGDPWPVGTLKCFYVADLLVMLKGEIPGFPYINGVQVDGLLLLHVIPIRVDDGSDLGYHKEYRLWKWRDLTDGFRTEQSNWGQVKALY